MQNYYHILFLFLWKDNQNKKWGGVSTQLAEAVNQLTPKQKRVSETLARLKLVESGIANPGAIIEQSEFYSLPKAVIISIVAAIATGYLTNAVFQKDFATGLATATAGSGTIVLLTNEEKKRKEKLPTIAKEAENAILQVFQGEENAQMETSNKDQATEDNSWKESFKSQLKIYCSQNGMNLEENEGASEVYTIISPKQLGPIIDVENLINSVNVLLQNTDYIATIQDSPLSKITVPKIKETLDEDSDDETLHRYNLMLSKKTEVESVVSLSDDKFSRLF